MNNIFVEIPGSDNALEVTPYGLGAVSELSWYGYSSFVIWSKSEFFHCEREYCDNTETAKYAGAFWSVSEVAHEGVSRFYFNMYGKTVVYRVEHLGRAERLVSLMATDDYGSIVYPSSARYDGFASRLVGDYIHAAVYWSGYLFDLEFVYDNEVPGGAEAMLWQACRRAVVEDCGWWEMDSVFDGERQLYKVRRML